MPRSRKPRPESERTIEDAIIERLAWHGVIAMKNVVEPGRFSFAASGLGKGSTDLVCVDVVDDGRAGFLEVKVPGQKSKPEQLAFRARMRRAGAVEGEATSPEEAVAVFLAARAARRRRVA